MRSLNLCPESVQRQIQCASDSYSATPIEFPGWGLESVQSRLTFHVLSKPAHRKTLSHTTTRLNHESNALPPQSRLSTLSIQYTSGLIPRNLGKGPLPIFSALKQLLDPLFLLLPTPESPAELTQEIDPSLLSAPRLSSLNPSPTLALFFRIWLPTKPVRETNFLLSQSFDGGTFHH